MKEAWSCLCFRLWTSTLVVAVDPGKVMNRVWLSDGTGSLVEPVSMPVSRDGIAWLERMVRLHDVGHSAVVIAVEATGSLHRSWVSELERRYPGAVQLFAPSETKAARTQLGSARFKTDDRDCAALTYLARQGAGRRWIDEVEVDALRAVVRHRRGLVHDRKVIKQRLHDQLNALAPGLSAPAGHGRGLALEQPSGQAVLACAVAFAGRAPTVRSLQARATSRFRNADAQYWAQRWRACLPPPYDAERRAQRLSRDLARYQALQADIAAVEIDLEHLLVDTDCQVLTTLPGVAVVRAAGFAAHSLPIDRYPDAEHLYSATGLAPALYESATLRRRGRISRQGLAEHRDALMGIAWGLSRFSPSFAERDREYRNRGMTPIQSRVALARHACRLAHRLLSTQEPFDEERYRQGRRRRGR
jgi:transposase